MKDIVEALPGLDLGIQDSIVPKSGNVLSVQLGDLEYSPDFGVDFKFFLESQFQIQNSSFKAYLVQRLTEHQVNVAEVIELVENLSAKLTFYVGSVDNSSGGLGL